MWEFYNSGPGIISYVPFPADKPSPIFGQTLNAGAINLTWVGGVVNSHVIANYDVYFEIKKRNRAN
jgi:hypothetical protein